jgi:hypothetical protein
MGMIILNIIIMVKTSFLSKCHNNVLKSDKVTVQLRLWAANDLYKLIMSSYDAFMLRFYYLSAYNINDEELNSYRIGCGILYWNF